MTQKKRIVWGVCIFLFCAGLFVFFSSRREYVIHDSVVRVNTPQAKTVLEKYGKLEQDVYIVVGEGINENDYYQTELPVLRMGTVEKLTQRYGDFRRCNQPGSTIGKESVISLRLIGEDSNITRKIAEIYERSRKKSDFIVRVEGTELRVLEHITKSNRANIPSSHPYVNVLVRDIEMSEPM